MATTDKKYLDLEGLETLVNKIKEEDNKRVPKITGVSATSAAFYKVGINGDGLVNKLEAFYPKTLTIQANGTNQGTFDPIANLQDQSQTINITLDSLGLTGAMHFKGVFETLPATANYNAGDVVLVGSKEYVLANNGTDNAKKWNELGDESSHALKTIKISAGGGLTGGGDLSSDRTISHVTTTAVGAAAVKVGKDTYGHVILGDALGLESNGAHTHNVTGTVSVPKITSNSTYIKATASGAAIGDKTTAKAITSVTPTQSKLMTTSIWGVGGTASVIPATTIATGSRPTRTVLGTATTASKLKANSGYYGNANVGTSVDVLTKVNTSTTDKVFSAAYDSDSLTLNLTPVTVVASVAATSSEILPAAASTTTLASIFSDVSVPVISSNAEVEVAKAGTAVTVATRATAATTVATGAVSTNGDGADVVTGLTTGTTDVLTDVTISTQPTIALEKVTKEETGAINVLDAVSVGTETANVSGTAASSGSHTHTFK